MRRDLQKLKASWDLFNDSIVAAPRSCGRWPFSRSSPPAFSRLPCFRPLTIEGYRFGEFVSAALLLIQVMLTLSLLQFVFLWSRLKQLLDRMAWHPLAAAAKRVPRALFPTDLFPPDASFAAAPDSGCELEAARRRLSAGRIGGPGRVSNTRRGIRGGDAAVSPHPWSSNRTWRALLGAGSMPRHGCRPMVGRARRGADAKREEFLASLMVFVIRDASRRLGHNLVFNHRRHDPRVLQPLAVSVSAAHPASNGRLDLHRLCVLGHPDRARADEEERDHRAPLVVHAGRQIDVGQ